MHIQHLGELRNGNIETHGWTIRV